MSISLSPDDGRALLLAIGLGAIVGMMFGGWVMTALYKVLMAVVKMSLFGGLIVLGVLLWNGRYATPRQQPLPTATTNYAQTDLQASSPISPHFSPVPSTGRWWEQ